MALNLDDYIDGLISALQDDDEDFTDDIADDVRHGLELQSAELFNHITRRVVTVVADYTVPNNTNRFVLADSTSGVITVELPSAVSAEGKLITIKRVGLNTVTIEPDTELIDGAASVVLSVIYDAVTVTSDGSNFYVVSA